MALDLIETLTSMSSSEDFLTDSWRQGIDRLKVRKEDLNKLVMDYLVANGHFSVAEKFQIESGTEMGIDLAAAMAGEAARNSVLSGNIDGAIRGLNGFNPEILNTNPKLFFYLQQQKIIELIHIGGIAEALQVARVELGPRCTKNDEYLFELERTATLLLFQDPTKCRYGELLGLDHRLKIADEVNAAILMNQNHEKESLLSRSFQWLGSILSVMTDLLADAIL